LGQRKYIVKMTKLMKKSNKTLIEY
jgi:hypothetical protein